MAARRQIGDNHTACRRGIYSTFFFCFCNIGTRAETWTVRQRLANAARRDAQLYQIAFADGRIGSVDAQRAAHYPHRIPVSFFFFFLIVCGWSRQSLFCRVFVSDSLASLLSIYWVVKTIQSSTRLVKESQSVVVVDGPLLF